MITVITATALTEASNEEIEKEFQNIFNTVKDLQTEA